MAATDTCNGRPADVPTSDCEPVQFIAFETVKKGSRKATIMFKKDPLQRVALTLPKSLLHRLDTRLGLEKTSSKNGQLARTQLIARAITFYLAHHESAEAERMAFSRSVEARLTRLIQADHELLELLLRLYVVKEHITEQALKAELKYLRKRDEQPSTTANAQPKKP